MRIVVYGGHYGSEGKGSATEWLIKGARRTDKDGLPDRKLVAFGENSPNSGHTCSVGKTRNLPAAAYFADIVVLGPDSAVNPDVLLEDISAIQLTGRKPEIYIHENAAVVTMGDISHEKDSGIIDRVSSTGSGSGAARSLGKQYLRLPDAVLFGNNDALTELFGSVKFCNHREYMALIKDINRRDDDCVFECSQGVLLDVNFGRYPFVTSRSTLPRVAIERNALASLNWAYCGVYRTFPIRTGGPSGPTGGTERTFESIGVKPEIATVTKRTRRVFEFSMEDFVHSIELCRPQFVAFTHLDYINIHPTNVEGFFAWYNLQGNRIPWRVDGLFLSNQTGVFVNHGAHML